MHGEASLFSLLYPPITSTILGSNIILFSDTLSVKNQFSHPYKTNRYGHHDSSIFYHAQNESALHQLPVLWYTVLLYIFGDSEYETTTKLTTEIHLIPTVRIRRYYLHASCTSLYLV
jgi:hypothetical protein